MPRSELIRQIRPTDEILKANNSGRVSLPDDSNRSAIEIELARQTLELSMILADDIRQSLTILRVSLERPGIVAINPQQLVSQVEDTVHRHILMANDIFLAAKLGIPKTQPDIRNAINLMPAHLRM